jgi:hypothetical protein
MTLSIKVLRIITKHKNDQFNHKNKRILRLMTVTTLRIMTPRNRTLRIVPLSITTFVTTLKTTLGITTFSIMSNI